MHHFGQLTGEGVARKSRKRFGNLGVATGIIAGVFGFLMSSASIDALFRNGEQGAWYDPSDHDTLATDHLGASPVNSVLSPDLTLDRSTWGGQTFDQVMAAQPELVTNGDFATDTVWVKGTGWTISGGVANGAASGFADVRQGLTGLLTVGKWYMVKVTNTLASGALGIFLGNSGSSAVGMGAVPANSTYQRLIKFPTGQSPQILIRGESSFTGTIDNVSIKEVPGNHYYAPAPAGQAIGLMYDKRLWGGKTRAQVLAANPELVTNGDFANNIAGWTAGNNAALSHSTGRLLVTNNGAGFGAGYQAITCVVGKRYRLTLDFTHSGTSGAVFVGSTFSNANAYNSGGLASSTSLSVIFTATATTMYVAGTVNSATTTGVSAAFDNISVKELDGNHVQQATQASKPFLARLPYGEPQRNLFVQTQRLFGWSVQNTCVVTQDQIAGPNDGLAPKIDFSASNQSSTYRSNIMPTAGTYTMSVWARGVAGDEKFRFLSFSSGQGLQSSADFTLTTAWQRFSWTVTVNAATHAYISNASDAVARSIYASDAQLELGSTMTAYQRIGSAYSLLRNKFVQTKTLDHANWTKNNVTIVANQIPGPSGEKLDADMVVDTSTNGGHAVYQNGSLSVVGGSYCFSALVKAGTHRYIAIRGDDIDPSGAANCPWVTLDTQAGTIAANAACSGSGVVNLGNGWFYVWLSYIAGHTTSICVLAFASSSAALAGNLTVGPSYVGTGSTFYVAGTQLEEGLTPTAMQDVVSQYDVSEAGKRDLWSLRFDGTDDHMLSANVDFSGTDKLTIITAARKNTDIAVGTIVGIGETSTQAGSVGVYSSSSQSDASRRTWGVQHHTGSTLISAGVGIFVAPATSVLTAAFDRAQSTQATEMKLRVDSVDQTLTFSGAGLASGNHANQPICIGRNAASGQSFPGDFYGAVIYGHTAAMNDNQRNQIEQWMKVKAGLAA